MSSYAITDVVQLHPQDNVCVAARNLEVGEVISVDDRSFTVTEEVRLGHKIALTDIASGEPVESTTFPTPLDAYSDYDLIGSLVN